MKQFTLIILVLTMLCNVLSAQSEVTHRSDFFDKIVKTISIDNDQLIILSEKGRFSLHKRVYRMNKWGKIINHYELPPFENYIIEDVMVFNNNVFISGIKGSCDYFVEEFLSEFDIEGNLLSMNPVGVQLVESNSNYSSVLPEVIEGINTQIEYIGEDMTLILSSNDTIELYDNQSNLLYTTYINDLQPIGDIEVTYDDQYIYIATYNRILSLDYTLQTINQFNWDFEVKAMIATNDSLTIIGNDGTYTYSKRISSNFNFNNTVPDVGVVEILSATVDVIACGYDIYGFCYYGGCSYHINNIKVVVQNLGASAVFYYEVNALYGDDCPLYCNEDYSTYTEDYYGLLLPGQRDTVDFSTMYLRLSDDSPELCLYTTRPNFMIDKNRDNDRTCKNFETFLPIEQLTPLQAKIDNNKVLLTWQTATETNNEGFEIQKSKDGTTWQKIGWVAGQVNSLTPHAYRYMDDDLLSGITYYRFKQIDMDGSFSYSNIANISYEGRDIRVYPNPVKNTLHFADLNGTDIQYIIMYDQMGRQVLQTNTVNHSIDVSTLPTGIYMLEIATQSGTLYEKIMVE